MTNNSWRDLKLSEVVDIISGGTPKTSVSEYWSGPIPWLSVADFNNGKKFVSAAEKSITEIGLKNCSSKLLQKNDIIISARGTVGVVAMLEREMAFNQSCYGIRAKENSINEYIYYFLKSAVRDFLQVANGGVFDTITRQTFDEIEISLPPLPEQKAIAEVLTSLDDKIDLLHKQNKTLEQLAETLFRHYFIDNAKDDWEERPLDKIADFLNGLACQKYPPKNEIDKLSVLKIKELRSGFGEDCDWATTDAPTEYFVKSGDIIFSWSGSLLVKIYSGRNCILNQHLFKVTSPKYPKWFIYLWTKNHLEKFIEIAESKATTMGHIKRSDLSSSMVLVPSDDEIKEMDKIFTPTLEKIILNNGQISNIEKLRDQLLPKLMSGEVSLSPELRVSYV